MDVVKENRKLAFVKEEDTEVKAGMRQRIVCGEH